MGTAMQCRMWRSVRKDIPEKRSLFLKADKGVNNSVLFLIFIFIFAGNNIFELKCYVEFYPDSLQIDKCCNRQGVS